MMPTEMEPPTARYGPGAPDVGILVLPNVRREMISWVDDHFKARSLRTDVLFVTPQTRHASIQRQIVEGVGAVAELDASAYDKISMQVFDRTAGSDKVAFEQYRDLEPHVAAEVVIHSKAKAQQHAAAIGRPPMHHQYPPQMPPTGPAAAAAAAYPPQQQQPMAPQPQYGLPPNQSYPPHVYPPPHAGGHPHQQQHHPGGGLAQGADLASLVGSTDPATLHRLLSSLQNPAAAAAAVAQAGQQVAGAPAAYGAAVPPAGTGGAGAPSSYGPPQGYSANAGGGQGANGAAVHDLMAQLASIRR
jgi:hypothetical protein